MYLKHFNLTQEPFSIAPDPNFLYLSQGHREALAHLLYGFSHGGFVLVTGEVGTGKTTLLRNLIKQTPDELDVAFILNPRLTVRELLETICDELGVPYHTDTQYSIKQYIDLLNKHLLKTHQQGRSTVLIIDEAQNLSPAVLEQLRLLTNLETDERKLLRIILLGQPELGEMLERQELRQLAQRITARYHLGPLSQDDSIAYIGHRLGKAGGHGSIFTPGALKRLYRISKGIPRVLNVVADRSMLGAYVEGQLQVSAKTVDHAAEEVLGARQDWRAWYPMAAAIAAGVMLFTLLLVLLWPDGETPDQIPREAGTSPRQPPVATTAPPVAPVAPPQVGTIARQPAPTPAQAAAAPSLARPQASQPGARAPDTERDSFDELFRLWNVDFSEAFINESPCDFALAVQLACLQRKGRWSDILRLDLPVILELWDVQEKPYYAAVVGATDTRFILALGGANVEVAPRDLRDIWFGSYRTLWSTPPNYSGNLRNGDRHASVVHLRQQLARLPELALQASNSDLFDSQLEQAVLRFQNQEGLLADGIVGPATWIRLYHRLGQPGPSLRG